MTQWVWCEQVVSRYDDVIKCTDWIKPTKNLRPEQLRNMNVEMTQL